MNKFYCSFFRLNSSHMASSLANRTQEVIFSRRANIAWSTIFGFLAVIIVAGNALTIAAFTARRLVRRRAVFFLISLAMADMMVGAVAIPLYIYLSIQKTLTKRAVHHIYEAVDILSGLASVFTLALISVERLFAIGWPLFHRTLRKRAYFYFVGLAWISALIISIIDLLYHYNIVSYLATLDIVLTALCTSFVVTCAAYLGLFVKVRSRDYSVVGREQDKRLAKTLFLVTGMFMVTWLPFQCLLYVVHFCKTCPFPSQNTVNFIKLLQYFNSFINTVIYSLRMPEFRKAISEAFKGRRSHNPNKDKNIYLKNLQGDTLSAVGGVLGSYSSLNLRLCMGTENIVLSELNSSNLRRKCFAFNSSRNLRKSSSRRTFVTVSVV